MAMTLSIPRDAERDCRDRDLAHLAAALDDDLAEVRVFDRSHDSPRRSQP